MPYTLIFLSPPWERIEVRGNIHPHPSPLPSSREREIKVVASIGLASGHF
jgi:hypothetical protein